MKKLWNVDNVISLACFACRFGKDLEHVIFKTILEVSVIKQYQILACSCTLKNVDLQNKGLNKNVFCF